MRKEKNMNTQIVVSSVTGNTLKVAKAIFESLVNSNMVDKCALVKVEDYKNSDDFENVLAEGARNESKIFLKK